MVERELEKKSKSFNKILALERKQNNMYIILSTEKNCSIYLQLKHSKSQFLLAIITLTLMHSMTRY